ncbi:MAG: hypothetical protein GKR89_31100 [Candidatus Latescibacteria bacterium]|nr:hypothetical protein [Candidatus Latescibacterota bacterium]
MVEMEVNRVHTDAESPQSQIELREKTGDYRLCMDIGFDEATAIAMARDQRQPPRPVSYDLAHSLLGAVDAQVTRVQITALNQSVFFAEVHLQDDKGATAVIDSRPSDAIALALRQNAPIYAAQAVLEEAGYKLGEAPQPEPLAEAVQEVSPVSRAERLKKRLLRAVSEEAYEEAARLRDEIQQLEPGEETS